MESAPSDFDLLASRTTIKKTKRFKGFLMLPKALPISLLEAGISNGALIAYITIACAAYFDTKQTSYARFPFSVSQLAEMLQKSRNSVSTWLKELEQAGLIAKSIDGEWVVLNYNLLFLDRSRKLDDTPRFAFREDFSQALSELFPKLQKRRR